MKNFNRHDVDYASGVAGNPVTPEDAFDFIQGLEDFNNSKTVVEYEINEDGFLTTKKSFFNSLKSAMDFVRRVNSFTTPVIYDDR